MTSPRSLIFIVKTITYTTIQQVFRMSPHDRAAQFKPFAALTGYEMVLRETGRLTDERAELDENARAELERRLQLLSGMLRRSP